MLVFSLETMRLLQLRVDFLFLYVYTKSFCPIFVAGMVSLISALACSISNVIR
jgi:hypothetical protein